MKKHYAAFMLFLGGHLAYGQAFPTLDTNFNTTVVLVPSPIQITPLFSGSASMVKKPASLGGGMAPAKQNHDYIGFVPYNDSSDAQLLVNHELRGTDNNLDDGGGMTSFRVKRSNGQWQVDGDFNYVDFKSTVGGTYVNCGGGENPAGLVTTAEEFPPSNNVDLFNNGYRDTSDYVIPAGNAFAGRTIKRFQNFGWMVEVDPATGKATQKYYKMGRFSHEGALYINDGRTVYLTDDNTPGVLFKFEAAVANDYTDGQLFAYKQLPNSFDGTWVALPMEFDSLLDARGAALRRGATMFNRLEWVIQAKNGRIFFTETGRDNVTQFKPFMAAGTNMPARHMLINPKLNDGDSTFTDYYGRVLELIPGTNTVRVFVEGGTAAGSAAKNLASPDGLAATRINGRDFLLIHEDLNGASMGRDAQGNNICEGYFADASKTSVEVDDLVRMIIGPNGAELTGGVFTPDGKTLFINVQHPDNTNTPPYNNATTIAVTNYAQFMNTLSINEQKAADKGFQVYPNPATREITFNKVTDIAIYNLNGEKVRVFRNTDKADVSTLTPGVYFVQTLQGEVNRLIVQ